ncbi:hypothetical protein Alg130_09940 [Pyrenophora tritici-repentis]|nr:hypothetical protein Alg130_09940 [Pyrenophora tritici-repentis]
MSTIAAKDWFPYINGVVVGTNTHCVLESEQKEGSARTSLFCVKYGDKTVLLIGFIRQREDENTARDIVAQALVTSYNPPNGWNARIIWICVFDPFNSKCILAQCTEDINTGQLEVETFGKYDFGTEGPIMQHALTQNIETYAG